MGSKKKPLYDAEFREGAVRIVVETGKPVGDVAEELGINPGTLHSWVSRWRRNGTTSSDRPVPPGGRDARRSSPRSRSRMPRVTGSISRHHSATAALPFGMLEALPASSREGQGVVTGLLLKPFVVRP